jgi:flagellar hook protein FlgE
MSIISSMSTAISGLEANGQDLGIVSDNIVNANTTGFKSSRGEFQSVLAQDMGGTGGEIGHGTRLGGVTTVLNQGSITKTDRATDVAMNGNGFFVLKSDTAGYTFTRDGGFTFDKDGWLTALNGQKVQAYMPSAENKITAKLGNVKIPFNSLAARATNHVDMHLNLDARQQVGPEFDPRRPDDTAQFNASVQVYDSIGNAHAISVYYNKTGDGAWDWHAMTDGGGLAGGNPGEPAMVSHGTLSFDPHGKLVDSSQMNDNLSFSNGAIPDQELKFDFGAQVNGDGEGRSPLDRTTQYGSKSSLFRSTQDGWAAGYFVDISVDKDGNIQGSYTNGQNRVLGQLAIARFDSPERLAKQGQNQFRETVASGQASIGSANTNGRGSVMPQSLEGSNVDMAKEFVEMIRAQRGFQASAKSITTGNEMLEEVINLKRT